MNKSCTHISYAYLVYVSLTYIELHDNGDLSAFLSYRYLTSRYHNSSMLRMLILYLNTTAFVVCKLFKYLEHILCAYLVHISFNFQIVNCGVPIIMVTQASIERINLITKIAKWNELKWDSMTLCWPSGRDTVPIHYLYNTIEEVVPVIYNCCFAKKSSNSS